MLAYFPKPYPDELFYSVLCRLKVHLGVASSVEFSKFLYGDRTVPSCINFPVKLQKIVDNLPIETPLAFNDFLENNSMLNYYLPFISEDKHDLITRKIADKTLETKDLDRLLGGMSSKVPSNQYLRYCKECMGEDISNYGEPYYHRAHQLPGVKLCYKHKIPLSNSKYFYNAKLREEWLTPLTTEVEEVSIEEVLDEEMDFAEYVALESYKLLNSKYDFYGIPYLKDKYITEFIKANLATINRHSNHTEIQKLMDKKIPITFLKDFVIDNKDTYWLAHLTGGHNSTSIHPLRLICLNYSLGLTMKDIFNGLERYKPFGDAPWLCLNPVCAHYKKSVIKIVTLRTNKKDSRPLGVFTCPYCGYSYMRKGPDVEKQHLEKKSRTLNYGTLFKEKLLHLVDIEGESFNSLSKNYFDGMDGKALKMWYKRWKNETITANKFSDDISNNREFWTDILSKYPDKKRSFFQKRFVQEYRWCYTHDNAWFEENFPKTAEPVSKNTSFTKGNKSRLKDWHQEDLEYSEKITFAINDFKREFPKTRASYALIEKRLNRHGYCSKYKDKLPISFKILNDFVLSTKDFKRKINK